MYEKTMRNDCHKQFIADAGPPKRNKFKIGDYVRVSIYKKIFDKGYLPNWTTEIFQIYKVQRTEPITYLISDYQDNKILGSFYEQELQHVRHHDLYLVEKILKKKNDMVSVKWLGFDSSHNSWVKSTEIG